MPNRGEDAGETSVYEIGFLVLPSIPEDKVSLVTAELRKAIAKEGGKEIDAEEPSIHPLSYQMSKTVGASRYVVDEAYIGWIKFEVESTTIQNINAGVEKINEVLRFLLVKAPRETTFTFAKAREAAVKKDEPIVPSPVEEPVVI